MILLVPFLHSNVVFRLYATLLQTYPHPNERCPFVDTPEFEKHPSFGKPVNGRDLFHGTKSHAYGSIVRNGFDVRRIARSAQNGPP
jgi:hypothetical protein